MGVAMWLGVTYRNGAKMPIFMLIASKFNMDPTRSEFRAVAQFLGMSGDDAEAELTAFLDWKDRDLPG